MQTYFFNRLPHYTPLSASYFITFRLYDSLPKQKFIKIKEDFENDKINIINSSYKEAEKAMLIDELKGKYFKKYETQLDNMYGSCFLKDPKIASLVSDHLMKYDNHYYDLYAYVIMPNHIHLLIDTAIQSAYIHDPQESDLNKNYKSLPDIVKLIKGGSAFLANKTLKRKGSFWAPAYFDRYIRDEDHWNNTINYIISNPVNANLTKHPEKWPHTYIKE